MPTPAYPIRTFVTCSCQKASLGRLDHLGLRWRRQLGAEDAVPEAAGDAEAVLVVGEVVLQVVLLEFAPVGWEAVREIIVS